MKKRKERRMKLKMKMRMEMKERHKHKRLKEKEKVHIQYSIDVTRTVLLHYYSEKEIMNIMNRDSTKEVCTTDFCTI